MHACAVTNRTNHITVSSCVQHRMKDTQHCLLQSRIYRALHNSVERDCQHHEFQCECFKPLHTLLGFYPVYRDTNSLVVKSANNNNNSCSKAHTFFNMRICVYTPRRLQWIVVDCKRNLQQRQKTLHKKKYCRCTSYKSTPHLNRVYTCSRT